MVGAGAGPPLTESASTGKTGTRKVLPQSRSSTGDRACLCHKGVVASRGHPHGGPVVSHRAGVHVEAHEHLRRRLVQPQNDLHVPVSRTVGLQEPSLGRLSDQPQLATPPPPPLRDWGVTRDASEGGEPPPPTLQGPAYARPLSPCPRLPAPAAFVTDSNRPGRFGSRLRGPLPFKYIPTWDINNKN